MASPADESALAILPTFVCCAAITERIARANAHDADPERICELFDAAHDAVTTDSDLDVEELTKLADLAAEETA